MKKLILVISLLFISYNLFAEDINPNQKPEALKSVEFEFPKYTTTNLSNGLKVYLIEDKEQPTIALRLMIFGGSSVETKGGISELTAGMLTKGTKKFTASKLADTLDGFGIDVSSNSSLDYYSINASGLNKYSKLILEIMSDVLLNPTFPKDEFAKLQQQSIAGLQYEKSNPGSIAQKLAKIVVYGKDNPYSKYQTEESINSISTTDLQEFHSTWAKPNNASLAIVGDFNSKDMIKELEKYFKNWKKGKVPEISIPAAQQMSQGIYFISRPSAVQTSIVVSSLAVPSKHNDYLSSKLTASLFGGSNGRLFLTLREKYSFTYSPYGFLSSSKYLNRFAAVADVAKDKTDSSLTVIIDELKDLASNSPNKAELERVKTSFIGNYNMSFENSMFVANLIQDGEFNGEHIEEIKNYTKKIQAIPPSEISAIVQKYINPENLRIVVVGDPSILPSLEKYGQIFQYDMDLNALEGADAKLEKVSLSPKDLVNKYEKAIGGKSTLQGVNTINAISSAELFVNGQVFDGEVLSQKKAPNKLYNYTSFQMFNNQSWVDGENCWTGSKGQPSTQQTDESKDKMLFDAEMFSVLSFDKHNYKLEVLGKNSKYILMKALSPANAESIYYFNKDNYLLEKIDLLLSAPDGTPEIWSIVTSDYKSFDGVMLPTLQKTIAPSFVITLHTNYTINQPIEDEVFKPEM